MEAINNWYTLEMVPNFLDLCEIAELFQNDFHIFVMLLMILSKIVYVCIFCFQSVGRVHIMGQVKLVIV